MANPNLPNESGWVQIRREGYAVGFRPIITLRSRGTIAFSADFVRMADIRECTHCEIFVSTDGRRLAFRFLEEPTADSFAMSADGGGNKRRKGGRYPNRIVQAPSLKLKSPIFGKLGGAPESVRRYEPRKELGGLWTVNLAPCFENTFRLKGEIGHGESGIYRYRLGGETVYIGRGRFIERFAQPERAEWQFDAIEYSILNDPDEEARWEAHWLELFREEHNRWPVYNRVGGLRAVVSKPKDAGVG